MNSTNQSSTPNEDSNRHVKAKQKTIEELKGNEAAKDAATNSLISKLNEFKEDLSEDEKTLLSQILESGMEREKSKTPDDENSVHLKPMQGHTTGGGGVTNSGDDVYLKPMQGHTTGGGGVTKSDDNDNS